MDESGAVRTVHIDSTGYRPEGLLLTGSAVFSSSLHKHPKILPSDLTRSSSHRHCTQQRARPNTLFL